LQNSASAHEVQLCVMQCTQEPRTVFKRARVNFASLDPFVSSSFDISRDPAASSSARGRPVKPSAEAHKTPLAKAGKDPQCVLSLAGTSCACSRTTCFSRVDLESVARLRHAFWHIEKKKQDAWVLRDRNASLAAPNRKHVNFSDPSDLLPIPRQAR
jgi:hypothetical protein